jgi:hypothetical protein
VLPPNLRGGAAQKLVTKLIDLGFVEEIRARSDLPVWRRDDNRPKALRITKRGLKAIAVNEPGDHAETSNQPETRGSGDARRDESYAPEAAPQR